MCVESFSYNINGVQRSGRLEYPDLWCFVFNPNYVTINMDDTTFNGQMTVTLSTSGNSYEIFVNLFKGTAKVYISKVLQLLLEDVEHHRTSIVTLSVSENNTAILSHEITCIAVWGGLQMGEQFGKYGAFVFNGKDCSHVRSVVWFRNFPFYVSMFRSDPAELATAYSDNVAPGTTDLRLYRCRIDRVTEGNLPTFETQSKQFERNPIVVFNVSHGVVYAIDGLTSISPNTPANGNSPQIQDGVIVPEAMPSYTGKAYLSWIASGNYGSSKDYSDAGLKARSDVEFEYKDEIVRWNNEAKQLERSTMGNAGREGIYELNPAITFPDAIKTAQYNVCLVKATSAIFNMNFNFPFPDTTKILYETVNLFISDNKDGMYLRWIDRFGLMQFYLFIEGESAIKTKASSNAVQVERTFSGMNFGNLERSIDATNTETRKCCAISLPKNVLEYVKTIVSAPLVDLYIGKNNAGTELWLPVSVSDGTYKTDPKTLLSDYEISIQMPEIISQTL